MSYDIVFFGGTGDLTWRKLMPALFQAYLHGALPEPCRILAAARNPINSDDYRLWLRGKFESLEWQDAYSLEQLNGFLERVTYCQANLLNQDAYLSVKDWVDSSDAQSITMYLATSPELFAGICKGLAAVGLNDSRVRVVLEKPLGHDLESAEAINRAVADSFAENQIFRIDHYLGKHSVQNLMALRFSNFLFEPLWRREAIKNVQITISEEIGVEQRGGYYDRSGALRDMVQNHLLQLLCIVAMEPPASADADAIRDEKLKVLRSLRVYKENEVNQFVVRGQYRDGMVDGNRVGGYLEEDGVSPQSSTETYVAIHAEIDNWRWAGVPFLLRTGKRLAKRSAEIVINFKSVPHSIYADTANIPNNRLVISLQPSDSIELHLSAKSSSRNQVDSERLHPVNLDLNFKEAFGTQSAEAYERLLLMVMAGRLDLFVRFDEQQAAWKWVMPILESWKKDPVQPKPYAAGTWGPPAASALVANLDTAWPEEI